MATPSLQAIDLTPGPDLHPLYPHASVVAPLLAPGSGLSPEQRRELVAHCVTRACIFGDIQVLTYLLSDPLAQPSLDLNARDEDGLGLLSQTILGFGEAPDPDREVEREECVRLLAHEGVDPNAVDIQGWTALHHAALLAPPTLVSYLLTHGCSPLTKTRRGFTALDIIAGYSRVPGRDDVALLLEEAMREEGWTGLSRRDMRRKALEDRTRRKEQRHAVLQRVGRVLGLPDGWYDDGAEDDSGDEDDVPEEDEMMIDDPATYDFAAMLVFSPSSLNAILESLVSPRRVIMRSLEPAKALHLLARFACISCDHTWLEDVIVGAVDKIEELVYQHPEDVPGLGFWLCNTTVLIHLLRTDPDVAETCDILGLFILLEELLNAIYVFIIRIAERRIDPLLDTCILDFAPPDSDLNKVQFDDEWGFFRSLRKKPTPATTSTSRPSSPVPQSATAVSIPLPPEPVPAGSPAELARVLHGLHTLLVLAGINPVIIAQAYGQILYWTGCELFNRLITRKKYLCRSRAKVIAANLAHLEGWVRAIGLPRGLLDHLAPLRELLLWLKVQSGVVAFDSLIGTMQQLRNLNPLQMRRAVKDYRFEVSEPRMTEECTQYLAQMQKDWERHRVQAGVERARRDMTERRERDDAESDSSFQSGGRASVGAQSQHVQMVSGDSAMTDTTTSQLPPVQQGIDLLFSRAHPQADWSPPRPSEALGELLDSRVMLTLVLPSDARLLASVSPRGDVDGTNSITATNGASGAKIGTPRSTARSVSDTSANPESMRWEPRLRRAREVNVELLDVVDGLYIRRSAPILHDVEDDEGAHFEHSDEEEAAQERYDRRLNGQMSPSAPSLSPQFTINPKRLKPGEHLRARQASTGDGEGEGEESEDVGVAL